MILDSARVVAALADLRRQPHDHAPLDTQLLFGEPVTCLEQAEAWACVRCETDGYIGWVRLDALGGGDLEASHRVAALATFRYLEPDLKAPVLDRLSFGSRVRLTGTVGAFGEVEGGGWVVARHVVEANAVEPDYVATALRFLGLPYLWGGRSSLGLDCSALVQLALAHAGLPAPRDSHQQADAIGEVVWQGGAAHRPLRGDLIFMPGHVVIALDETHVVNATAHPMLVVTEPLADVCARVAEETGRPLDRAIDVVRRP